MSQRQVVIKEQIGSGLVGTLSSYPHKNRFYPGRMKQQLGANPQAIDWRKELGNGPRLILTVVVKQMVVQANVLFEVQYSGWELHGQDAEPFRPIPSQTIAQTQWLEHFGTVERIAGPMAHKGYTKTRLRREISSIGRWIDQRWLPAELKQELSQKRFESLEILSEGPFPALERSLLHADLA